MFNFFIIMDEIQGNNIARNFSSEYFNYTINFIISKEFPALTDFPDFSLILCDLDKNIELAKKHNLPVIAFSHKNNRQESLMGTPWLILDTDGLSPFFLNEVYCRHYKKPLTITITNRCIIRELTTRQLPELLQLQEENKNNPSGCFFPQNCTTYAEAEEFLQNYIKNQYAFYGYGIYGIFNKENETFLGIAGFSPFENVITSDTLNSKEKNFKISENLSEKIPGKKSKNISEHSSEKTSEKYPENDFNEYSAEIGYSVLKKWQQQGIASEILPPLIHFGKEYLGFTKIVTRIEKNNIASIRLAKKNNLKILICQATEQTNS